MNRNLRFFNFLSSFPNMEKKLQGKKTPKIKILNFNHLTNMYNFFDKNKVCYAKLCKSYVSLILGVLYLVLSI